ncbi:tape measure protein [Bacteroides cellulosilyticus]|jgi:tape measure domain-containing protein|uniref:Tape measure protein n=1 Tax=Bacteroides cellulosilyticus TaxID=246787 RepID=A0A642PV89_9BACE|nr:tape measure protein [Bacteroides cellulosilyticus]KAA5416532.1 tape measure protein [Bacteroides cellulosilyticus]
MARLYFKVASDWEEVVRLRNEIVKLKQELKGMDSTQSPAAFKTLNTQLSASTQKMDGLVNEAAKAGAMMEGSFKKKIFDASQSVNGFTEKIIAQKAVVKDIEADIKRLGDAYRIALKRNPTSANSKLEEYNAARKVLDEEKAALFGLTQQQAEARLSVKKLRDEYSLYKSDAKGVTEANEGITISWKKALAVIGGAGVLKALGSEIIRVRGEFQAADTAIQTLLGSKEKADALMVQVREYAKISPLEFSDVTAATQMMLGFNIEAERVPRYLQAIGDVSMGNTQKFNSLTLAFSQMSAAGKLMGQDLNQMINAGFNPLQMIAEKTGKSIATLKDEMSKGAISAEMVQQAFIDATSAGGRFYNMSENASKEINGQLSMMQDALDSVFNELGQKSEGVIMDGIQMTTSLIENYETVGKVLAGLVVTYGTYRTAVMLVTAAENGHSAATLIMRGRILLAQKAQALLNATMLKNPYVLLATVAIGAASAVWAFSKRTTEAQEVQERYNASKEDAIRKEESHRQEIQRLISVAGDEAEATANRNAAIESLKKAYPGIIEKYIDEEGHLTNLIQLQKDLNEEQSKRKKESNQEKLASINAKVRNQEEYVSGMSGSKEAINEANDVLKELQRQQKEAQAAVNTDYINARIEEAKNFSDDELKKAISQWKSSLSRVTEEMIGEFSRDEVSSFVKSLETLQSAREKQSKNKKYWETKKKEAETALNSIASSQKKLMDAGKFKGIDEAVVKSYKDNVKKLKEAEKELKVYDPSSKQEKASEKQKKEQQKSAKELLSLRRQNQQDEVSLMKEGTEKKLKQIDLDYQKELDAIKKQEKDLSEKQGGKLSSEQSIEISARYTNAENKRDKNIADVTKEQLKTEQQALNDYLKEYGTFQQQKFGIAQEYAEKIQKAQNEGERLILKKQRDIAIQNKETEVVKANIDWVTVFGEFGSMFSDLIKPALEEAKKYIRTDEFNNSDQASQKSLIDAINRMEKSLGGASGVNFKKLGEDVKAYQTAEQNRINAVEIETEALDKLQKAQEDYTKAQKDGTEEEKQTTANALDIARQNADIASANVKTQTDIANQAQQNMTDTATKLKASMENLLGGLQQLSSGGLYNAYSGIIKTVNGFKDVIGKTSDSLKEVPIVGWILSIIDVLKDGLSNLVGGLLDAVLNAVSGIISDVLSGDLFVTIGRSLRDGIGNILNAISFGGFNSLFGIGGNKKEVEEAINRLTDRNGTLQTAIEDLTDVMEASKGTKSVSAYADAKKLQKETEENYKKIAQEQARYSSAHHSWNYYWGGFNQEEISRLSNQIGRNWNGDIWSLSPEEMKMLRSNVDMWEKIQNTGKGGYGERLSEKLDDYIDQAGKMEELTNKLYEGLTGISFDSMYDSFIDNLMDMKYDAKAAAEDISEYFMRAMLSNKIGELYSDKLEGWWKKFGAAMEDNELTEAEREALQDEYMQYVEEAMKLRDELAAATGYDKISQESTSQSSTSRGFGTEMTHEDAGELSGRFTALQIAGEEVKNQNVIQSQSLNLLTAKADTILSVNTETRNIADDTRDLIAQSYLELVQISENTGAIVKPIQQMQRDIAEVKKNTAKL